MQHLFHPSIVEASSANDIPALVDRMVVQARTAARVMATIPTAKKNLALQAMAAVFRANAAQIKTENAHDLEAGRAAGLSAAMLDRLELNDKRIAAMADALAQVAELEDPVGEILNVKTRPNGLRIGQMRAPIGVIGIIYESRPNVTADAGALCLKSGNAVILRGGREAFHSNMILGQLMNDAALQAGLPAGAIQLVPTTDRQAVNELLKRNDCVDLIIPRGGRSLIEAVVAGATMPVIKHYDGNCFVYIDKDADPVSALSITLNAKTQRTGVCNAAESLLIHQDALPSVGRDVVQALLDKGVEVRADERLRTLFPNLPAATEEDWRTEYLDLIMTAGVVASAEEAAEFINTHGSHHTDAIITRDHGRAMRFLSAVDSACVFVNCSTRFSDGGEFGMGCEIGISTDKLHARGPMGLKELTTLKFIAFGTGQVRE